jgi:hypothetical protein
VALRYLGEAQRFSLAEWVSGELARAAQLLPQVVGVTFLGYDLVIAEYELWKQKVLQRQQGRGEPDS